MIFLKRFLTVNSCIIAFSFYFTGLTSNVLADTPTQIAASIDAQQATYKLRSRALTGTSSEGSTVDAYEYQGHYKKIVVEDLFETGRRISTFYYFHDALVQAQVISVLYKGYPQVDLLHVPPHKHLVIDPTDRILANVTYDFAEGRLLTKKNTAKKSDVCGVISCEMSGAEILSLADQYVRFMNTPPRTEAGDQGEWVCQYGNDNANCASFTHEE